MAFTDEDIKIFLGRSSDMGLCTLFALALSKEKQIAFNFNDFFGKIFPESSEYCYGYTVACYAMEIFDFNYKNGIITVTSSKLDSSSIKEILMIANNNIKEIKNIEEYFI